MDRGAIHILLLALILHTDSWAASAAGPSTTRFHLQASTLADALDRFSEQCGLQVVYRPGLLDDHLSPSIDAELSIGAALNRLLSRSGFRWTRINERTILIEARGDRSLRTERVSQDEKIKEVTSEEVARLSVITVNEDPHRVLPNETSGSAFGFRKHLLDTPRTVSFVSQETIDLFALSAVEDLVRVTPGVFTTTRFGIQGAVDVRNVPADTYFRGMKRLTLQGHGRSVLGAMDTIEVVKGPPSPIDGLGKTGGFTNVVPKSGRARLGGYLPHAQGFIQLTFGTDDRREASFGIGGPFARGPFHGGHYTYALIEDSDTFIDRVPIEQKVLQSAMSIDDFIGPFRLETGANYQLSGTSGALLNRVTQELIDDGRYIRGDPLVNLDLNGNGKIGYLEYANASPVRGNLSAANQPLVQRWSWPKGADGVPLPLKDFPRVSGIPQSMFDYLTDACASASTQCPDPTGALRSRGAGGPLPISGYVPIGFVLDPRTVDYDEIDLRHPGAYEREIQAEFLVGFLDLIYDTDPDFTIKNQLFVDSMDQFKVSEQPSGGEQDVLVLADKLTATRRWHGMPQWMSLESLASLIYRRTHSTGRRYGGDFSSHRTDAMHRGGIMSANTTFVHSYDNSNLHADGAPWTTDYDSQLWEMGAGILFDLDLFSRTNLLFGGRVDISGAKNTNAAGTFDPTTGTSDSPGAIRAIAQTETGHDRGTSWSVSLSHEVFPRVRPYVTYSRSSLTLDNNNNSLDNEVIRQGHIGQAELVEAGIKAGLWDDKLFVSSTVYEQSRTDGAADDGSALLNTDVTHVTTRGWETEVKWVPSERLLVSLYGLAQKSTFTLGTGTNILVDARALGFEDVLDERGNVIYPAEAFLYGGRALLALPEGTSLYEEKQGNPNVQFGLHTAYQFENGFGLTLSGNYLSRVHSGRLRLVELPEAHVLDLGAFWGGANWRVKLDMSNVLNTRYYRARTGDTLGDTHVQAMPARRWQVTLKYDF